MNTAQLFAIAIPFVVLLGAIVAGAWLNQRGLERQMDAFRSEIKAEIAAFKSEIKAEMLLGDSKIRTEIAVMRAEEIVPIRTDVTQVKKTTEKIERQLEAVFSRLIVPK